MKRTLTQIKKDIAAGVFAPVYFLTGDDIYSKKEFAQTVQKALNPDEFNFFREDASACNMQELLMAANSAPVFSNTRLIILNNADKLRKNAVEALCGYLGNPMPSTCFIVNHNDAKKLKKDKALPQACAPECEVINFDPLTGAALSAWIQNKFKALSINVQQDALMMMEDIIGPDLVALNSEIEKLSLYIEGRADKTVNQDDVLASVGFSKEENPFALTNAVTDCDKATALKLIDNLLAAKEEPVSILNKISQPVIKMLKVKRLTAAGFSAQEVVRLGGLFPWEGRLVQRASYIPSAAALTRALNKIIEADMAFKTSQDTDAAIMLKGIILTALSK